MNHHVGVMMMSTNTRKQVT